MKIYGVGLTYAFAYSAFLLFEIDATLIDIRDKRYCLRKIYVDRLVVGYLLIEGIGVFNRAVFYTCRATRTFILENVPRFLGQGYGEVTNLALYTVNFGVGENLYVGVPADLDQLG